MLKNKSGLPASPLKIGKVTNIDESKAVARVLFAEDNVLSYWLPVLQAKTFKDKFYIMPDINEHVACLMDERLEEGVVLGAIYSKQDEVPVVSKDKFAIKFNDGASFEYDKKSHILNINCEFININGLISHTGLLLNSSGVVSEGEVIDHTSSMQAMRGIYNPHTHTGNQGSATSPPDGSMS